MRLVALSDLHINSPDDPLLLQLNSVLKNELNSGDVLILAGDIFDLCLGNAFFFNKYRAFFYNLEQALDNGVAIHYVEGNHDFHLRKLFSLAGAGKVILHSRDMTVELDGRRFYVAHGDCVDQSDLAYRAWRAFARSPILKAMIAVTPGKWADAIGRGASQKSRVARGCSDILCLDDRERLRRIYRGFAAERVQMGFDFVILGHCHDLDEMSFKVGPRVGHYINIGYPRAHGSMVTWTPGESKPQREALPSV